jgi:hypothetical protein
MAGLLKYSMGRQVKMDCVPLKVKADFGSKNIRIGTE